SSGHLFTSLSVSATTLCSSCNKSITAKEALSCPGCNVTIHNRCRDSVASCAKMKQRQQKLTLVRNNSALQNVALRTKTPMMKERPSSAIYPSDTLRQSLLGSRRVRTGLTLAKSVSTNNIAGGTEESVGLRRILSQSTESLNFRNRTLSMESLTDDGEWWWSPLLEELQEEGGCVQADSWSMAVDSKFLQMQHKDVIKQQDVIYELIQTEFHHVRTLRIMEGVYRRGMQEEVLLEAGVVHTIFPCLDQLLELHTNFLSQLLSRRKDGLQEGSTNNFTVRRLGDLLLRQFSGQCAEDMKKLYSEFCSRHPKAVKLYKEVLNRDRRLQQFIRRVCRGPLLRRHGVQECILLVTQRITKYPVLIQRILDNTKGEAPPPHQALVLLKELIGSVDQEVLELDRNRRLQEVQARLDPRAQAEVKGGGAFRGGELLRRKLLHEGTLTWKVQGSRMKGRCAGLADVRHLSFPPGKGPEIHFCDKSPVVSLTKLIVREVANQEKGMYLISDSAPPEMYELYASSKDDRKTSVLRPATVTFLSLRLKTKLYTDIQQKDKEVLELLQERATLFSDLVQATAREDGEERRVEAKTSSCNRNLFRADTPHAPKAEPLLLAAIGEGEEVLLGPCWTCLVLVGHPGGAAAPAGGAAAGGAVAAASEGGRGGQEGGGLRKEEKEEQREGRRLQGPAGTSGEPGDVATANSAEVRCFSQQVDRKPEAEPPAVAPLAVEDPVDQLDGLEEGLEEEEDEEVMKISPRSDSPRGQYRRHRRAPHCHHGNRRSVTPQTSRTFPRRARANLPVDVAAMMSPSLPEIHSLSDIFLQHFLNFLFDTGSVTMTTVY
uniref:Uncharacterized protein n=1 Tax=Xiphophorus couchianus TaxID=32473 RepID=A0A3B5MTU6_9TELE